MDITYILLSRYICGGSKHFCCSICGKLFPTYKKLRRHNYIHGTKRHQCSHCNRKFLFKHAVSYHIRTVHQDKSLVEFLCSHCGKRFKEKPWFEKHLKLHDPNYQPEFQCSVCGQVLSCNRYLETHVRKRHSRIDSTFPCRSRKYCCDVCGKELLKKNMKNHMMSHTGEKPFNCEHCGKGFITRKCLNLHTRTHTKERPYRCTVCDKSFTQKYSVTIHMRYHTGERPFRCPICFKKFVTHSELKVHVCAGPKDANQCPICLKIFASQGNLKRHSYIHSELKKFERFICKICDLDFGNNENLQRHMKKLHLTDHLELGKCPFCRRQFKIQHNTLKKHVWSVHDPQYKFCFVCSICDKVMTYESSYVKHVITHDQEQPDYRKRRCVCEICGKDILKKNIQPHMKGHLGVKPHKCPYCDKSFTNRKILRHHIRTHTKEKPHKCPVCAKGFTQPYTVTIHMRYHTGERPFNCCVCKRGFVTKAELKHHSCKGPQNFESQFEAEDFFDFELEDEQPTDQYQCGICSKIFPNKNKFIEHHINMYNKKLTCCKCSVAFKSLEDLYEHHETHKDIDLDFNCQESQEDEVEQLVFSDEVIELPHAVLDDGSQFLYILDEPDDNCVNEVVIQEDELVQNQEMVAGRKLKETLDLVNMEHGYMLPSSMEADDEKMVLSKKISLSNAPGCGNKRLYTPPKPRAPQPRRRHEVPDFSATEFIQLEANEELDTTHYKCIRCEQIFINKFGFFRHIEKGKCFINSCDVCNATFSKNSEFYSHYIAQHTDRAICNFCFRTFMYEKNVKGHMLRHLDQFRHRCEECNKGFYTVREYRSHYKNRHMGIRHKCDVCGRSFADEYYFKKHIATHAKVNFTVVQLQLSLLYLKLNLPSLEWLDCQVVLEDILKNPLLKFINGRTRIPRFKYKCYVCSTKFFTNEDLMAHKTKYPKKECQRFTKIINSRKSSRRRIKNESALNIEPIILKSLKLSLQDHLTQHVSNFEIDKTEMNQFYNDYALLRPDIDPFLNDCDLDSNTCLNTSRSLNNNTLTEMDMNLQLSQDRPELENINDVLTLHEDLSSCGVNDDGYSKEASNSLIEREHFRFHLWPENKKKEYISHHFNKQVRIFLTDIKRSVTLTKEIPHTNAEQCSGRRRFTCYLCFSKFFNKDDLDAHKKCCSNEDVDESDESQDDTAPVIVQEPTLTVKEIQCEPETPVRVGTKYLCINCNEFFIDSEAINAHNHIDGVCKYYCVKCDRHFNTRGGFVVHVFQHNSKLYPKFAYKCQMCPDSFDDCYQLRRHYAFLHSVLEKISSVGNVKTTVICSSTCTVVPSSTTTLASSSSSTIVVPSSPTPTTVTSAIVSKPESTVQGPSRVTVYDCDVCYDVFTTEESLSKHKERHKLLMKQKTRFVRIEKKDLGRKFIMRKNKSIKDNKEGQSNEKMRPSFTIQTKVAKKGTAPPKLVIRSIIPKIIPELVPIQGQQETSEKPSEDTVPPISNSTSTTSNSTTVSSRLNTNVSEKVHSNDLLVNATTTTRSPLQLPVTVVSSNTTTTPLIVSPQVNAGSIMVSQLPQQQVTPNTNTPLFYFVLPRNQVSLDESGQVKPVQVLVSTPKGQKILVGKKSDAPAFTMPMITNVATIITEQSNDNNQKTNSVHTTHFEGEFAKFLSKSLVENPSATETSSSSDANEGTSNSSASSDVIVIDGDAENEDSRQINKPVKIIIKKNSNLAVTGPKVSTETPSTSTAAAATASSSKPKIFVKKLSELLDKPKRTMSVPENGVAFQCRCCNNIFPDRQHLYTHIRNYYICHLCPFRTCIIRHYRDHLVAHHQLYVCDLCNFANSDFNVLQSHKKRCHRVYSYKT
ncbi:hypothetical protein GWI33_008314 [Rhynchophorus ferrugineus]|uniref:C2H2-type domain-containing protein n=1 Tax=Rhynchophorus ferrugineus TaxID=354439 RepID=A0A834IU03_RHYFE|nr:hypothetical protein GWI33_008314 [Rhynchophorus ferrugineus]